MTLKDWLRVFRAQTAPALVLLTLPPYLHNAAPWTLAALSLVVLSIMNHWFIFGHNSLMDTAMGYDLPDPSKRHHPLVNGRIPIRQGHNVIHWGLNIVLTLEIFYTLWLSPAPVKAIAALLIWIVWGFSYNNGLSKESLLGFIPISVCFAAWAAWGWFLSHETLGFLGWCYVAYMFFTILYQISWSGFIKDFEMGERSNILQKMGARLYASTIPVTEMRRFSPGKAFWWGFGVKFANIAVLWIAYSALPKTLLMTGWMIIMTILILAVLMKALPDRDYDREKELKVMSIMEILTIYMPIPLFVGWGPGLVMMVAGVCWFVGVNKLLWGKSTPGV